MQRLGIFLAAYGSGPSEAQVISAAVERQTILVSEANRSDSGAMNSWASNCRDWTVRHMRGSRMSQS